MAGSCSPPGTAAPAMTTSRPNGCRCRSRSCCGRSPRAADAAAGRRLVRVEVELPRQAARRRSGTGRHPRGRRRLPGGLAERRSTCCPRRTRSLVVSDASQEFTAPELAFLRQCTVLCPRVVSVLTKTDVHQHWRTVAELTGATWPVRGLDVPLVPVASPLELMAVERGDDRALREESGVPGPVRAPAAEWSVDRAEALTVRSIRHDLTLGRRAAQPWRSRPSSTRSGTRRGSSGCATWRRPGSASRTSAAAPRAGRPCSVTASPTSWPTSTTTCATARG